MLPNQLHTYTCNHAFMAIELRLSLCLLCDIDYYVFVDATERPVGIYPSSSGTLGGLGGMIHLFDSTEEWLFETPHEFYWLAGSYSVYVYVHFSTSSP